MGIRDDTRFVQDTTGATYTVVRKHLLGMHPTIRDRYVDRVESLPEEKWGSREKPLCVTCLEPYLEGHNCGGSS